MRLAGWLSEGISERWTMLLLVNVFLFLISAAMDEIAVLVIRGPLLGVLLLTACVPAFAL